MVATAIIGSSLVGAGAQMFGASSAASAQTKAAREANALLKAQYDQTRQDLAPYRQTGEDALGMLNNRMSFLTSPIAMDQAALEKTPGYQFNLAQGLKATQSGAAARGLGVSGAAFKGASTFATGLADSTYQNQFNNENTNRTNEFNRLFSTSQMGQSAAAQTGTFGANSASQQAGNLVGIGNANAAADISMGKAVGNAAGSIPSALAWSQYFQNANTGSAAAGNGGKFGFFGGGTV